MEHVIEASDPNTYVDVHGQLQWENAMVEEYESLMKNDIWASVH